MSFYVNFLCEFSQIFRKFSKKNSLPARSGSRERIFLYCELFVIYDFSEVRLQGGAAHQSAVDIRHGACGTLCPARLRWKGAFPRSGNFRRVTIATHRYRRLVETVSRRYRAFVQTLLADRTPNRDDSRLNLILMPPSAARSELAVREQQALRSTEAQQEFAFPSQSPPESAS